MKIHESVFIAPGAVVLGDVTMGEDASIWYHVTVRGDRYPIVIGRGTNVQDNCVIHVGDGYSTHIGDYVTIGHGAIVHGCEIGDNSLIGMGAVLMNGSVIGKNCIVAASALITEGTHIPDNSLVLGCPGKIKRRVTEEEMEKVLQNARLYVEEARQALKNPPEISEGFTLPVF